MVRESAIVSCLGGVAASDCTLPKAIELPSRGSYATPSRLGSVRPGISGAASTLPQLVNMLPTLASRTVSCVKGMNGGSTTSAELHARQDIRTVPEKYNFWRISLELGSGSRGHQDYLMIRNLSPPGSVAPYQFEAHRMAVDMI